MTLTNQSLELSDLQFAKLRGIIHANTGITIADGRKGLLLSRLRSRLREMKEPDFKSYISRLQNDASELQELINRVTTNKTLFYRTPRIWNHFRDCTVPAFLASQKKSSMRVWSAASSTGEEAHTIGIMLEEFRLANTGFDYSVLGTDVSSRVLAAAEKGVYAPAALTGFRKEQPDLFRSGMVGDDADGFRVKPDIKARLKFKLHNLQKPLKNTSPFDAVFLRNVLIYFTIEDQENILRNVAALMPPTGTLYIGESETLNRLETVFEPIEPMVYRPVSGTKRPDA